jgi:hypothetical protein
MLPPLLFLCFLLSIRETLSTADGPNPAIKHHEWLHHPVTTPDVPAVAQLSNGIYRTDLNIAFFESFMPITLRIQIPSIPKLTAKSTDQHKRTGKNPICQIYTYWSRKWEWSKNDNQGAKERLYENPLLNVSHLSKHPGPSKAWQSACASSTLTDQILDHLDEYLTRTDPFGPQNLPPEMFTPQGKRNALSQFLGSIANLCCDTVTESMIGEQKSNNNKINKFMVEVSSSLAGAHDNIREEKLGLNKLGAHVMVLEKAITDRMEEYRSMDISHFYRVEFELAEVTRQQAVSAYQLQRLAHYHDIDSAQVYCSMNRFPFSIAPLVELEKQLTQVRVKLAAHNKKIANLPDNSLSFTELPLTHCLFAPNEVMVMLKVPVVSSSDTGKAVKITPVPFRSNDSICSVNLPTTSVYVKGHMVQVIEPSELCRKGLCRIYDYPNQYLKDAACVAALVKAENPVQILKSCSVTCMPARYPVITRLSPQTVALIHNQRTYLVCKSNGGQNKIPIPTSNVGFALIESGCDCVVESESGDVLISAPFPCPKTVIEVSLSHHIPYFMVNQTRMKRVLTQPVSMESPIPFNPANGMLDPVAMNLTDFHFTPIRFEDDPDNPFRSDFIDPPVLQDWELHFTNVYMYFSLALAILVILLIVGLCCICKIRRFQKSQDALVYWDKNPDDPTEGVVHVVHPTAPADIVPEMAVVPEIVNLYPNLPAGSILNVHHQNH